MDIRKTSDIICGACIAVFGLYVVYESSRLAYVSEYGPGPGFLPLWLGIGLLILALYLLLSHLSHAAPKPTGKPESWLTSGRVLGGWLAMMVAILLLPLIGFSLSLALLSVFLVSVLERRSPWTAVAVAAGLAVGFYLIFIFALGLSLPSNRWGF